jgi:hypothetical protein
VTPLERFVRAVTRWDVIADVIWAYAALIVFAFAVQGLWDARRPR